MTDRPRLTLVPPPNTDPAPPARPVPSAPVGEWLTSRQAAAHLAISYAAFRRGVADGTWTGGRLDPDGLTRFSRYDLDAQRRARSATFRAGLDPTRPDQRVTGDSGHVVLAL
ncbi:hypothetical protein NBH00_12790 [Paraconexibacter antarcticus]|uniref:Helix-turn-helix domain-containing protein n=1 Tax=Paraconexibacter antarcticus TaxID=2949664 RepID=A0ABY5DLQ6_9ACTN|nr:hypothetical protein [Paraconexibacter antarcticus]UTI62245.1 hypothetical protein NBH00_12790 [Paraconexibacter antarcticus]